MRRVPFAYQRMGCIQSLFLNRPIRSLNAAYPKSVSGVSVLFSSSRQRLGRGSLPSDKIASARASMSPSASSALPKHSSRSPESKIRQSGPYPAFSFVLCRAIKSGSNLGLVGQGPYLASTRGTQPTQVATIGVNGSVRRILPLIKNGLVSLLGKPWLSGTAIILIQSFRSHKAPPGNPTFFTAAQILSL